MATNAAKAPRIPLRVTPVGEAMQKVQQVGRERTRDKPGYLALLLGVIEACRQERERVEGEEGQ